MENVHIMDIFQNITGDVVCRMFFGANFSIEKINGIPITQALSKLI